MTFDEERGDRSGHGAFGVSMARQRYLIAMPNTK